MLKATVLGINIEYYWRGKTYFLLFYSCTLSPLSSLSVDCSLFLSHLSPLSCLGNLFGFDCDYGLNGCGGFVVKGCWHLVVGRGFPTGFKAGLVVGRGFQHGFTVILVDGRGFPLGFEVGLVVGRGFRHVFTVKLVVGRGYGKGFTVYVVVGHGFWCGVWWLGLFCRRGCDFGCEEKKKKIIIILLYYNRIYCKIKNGMWDIL